MRHASLTVTRMGDVVPTITQLQGVVGYGHWVMGTTSHIQYFLQRWQNKYVFERVRLAEIRAGTSQDPKPHNLLYFFMNLTQVWRPRAVQGGCFLTFSR